jgi:lipopolysaccharide transport system ATP-binding protein
MTQTVIRAEHLGKRYVLGRQRVARTAREALAGTVSRAWRAVGRRGQVESSNDTLWALDDVSFQVAAGEVVGIIGRNGAGKSTLLKVLSQITEPTTGFVDVTGRVGSLLEVGTGFHEDLTGRENTYLNGAILGMSKAEIDRKFDEIAAFAEVERFIDTPVKHYSSGMYMRLAFAVAAHLQTEILVVDEVLAVGDALFQKKCLGKMDEIARHGRTVLFISHNIEAIQRLCTRGMLLDRGRLVAEGPIGEVVSRYRTVERRIVDIGRFNPRARSGTGSYPGS